MSTCWGLADQFPGLRRRQGDFQPEGLQQGLPDRVRYGAHRAWIGHLAQRARCRRGLFLPGRGPALSLDILR
jgi:hypothetical protein